MAVNLKKEQINNDEEKRVQEEGENIQLLKQVIGDKQYSYNEIVKLLRKNKISEEKIGKCSMTLGFIMDGYMDATGEMGVGPIIFKNGKFMGAEYQNEQNSQKAKEKVEEKVGEKSPNYNNQPINKSIKQNCVSLINNEMEKMDVEDLLDYIFYVDPLKCVPSQTKIIPPILEYILRRYNLSTEKIQECLDFFNKVVLIVNGEITLPLNYSFHNIGSYNIIMKHITLDKVYYYHLSKCGCDYYLDLNDFPNSVQEYIKPHPIARRYTSKILFDSFNDLLLDGQKIDNLGLLIMAIKNYKNSSINNNLGVMKSDIWQALGKLVLDSRRINSCKFDMAEFIKNGQIECQIKPDIDYYKVGNIDRQYKSIYYGNGIGYNAKMGHLDRVIDNFLYENMVLLVKYEGEFNTFAIPSRYVYVVYNEDVNKRYFCICSEWGKQTMEDFISDYNTSYRKPCLTNLMDGQEMTSTETEYVCDGCYKYISLNQLYKDIIGIPTSFVTMEYLNNAIKIENIMEYENNNKAKRKRLFK